MTVDLWVGFKGLSLIRWVVESVARWRGRPALELFMDAKPPRALQTPQTVPLQPVEAVSRGLANYYRIQVTNTGRTTAKRCRIVISDIWYTDRGVWKKLVAWQPVPLIWSGKPGTTEIDLSPEQKEFVDLGHINSNYIQSNLIPATSVRVVPKDEPRPSRPAYFILDVGTGFLSQPNALTRGHYVLGVSAYSENAATERAFIELGFAGGFASLADIGTEPLGGVELFRLSRPPETGNRDAHELSSDGSEAEPRRDR